MRIRPHHRRAGEMRAEIQAAVADGVKCPRARSARLRLASRDYPNDASGVLAGVEAMLLADSEPGTAEELIRRVEKRKAVGPYHHAAHFAACAYAQMGRADEAVRWLREAAETGFPCYPLFAHDASLDPIRQDPRFNAFLADMQRQSETRRRLLFPDRG